MPIADIPQDETPALEDEQETPEVIEETQEEPAEQEEKPAEETKAETEESEELVITLDGEEKEQEPEESAVPWVRQLRKENRELKRKQREYEQRMSELQARSAQPAEIEAPGPKPTIESVEFDGEVYAQKLEQWFEKNSAYQAKQAEITRKQEAEKQAWQQKLQGYQAEKAKLKVPDYEEAEENVLSVLNVTQQGLLLKSKEPAKLVYALGNSSQKLAELAGITDPVDFVYAVAEIQSKIQVKKRTPPPVVDRPVRASTSGVSVADQQLEKLKEKARQTGDYSEYFRAKNARKG